MRLHVRLLVSQHFQPQMSRSPSQARKLGVYASGCVSVRFSDHDRESLACGKMPRAPWNAMCTK